MKLLYNEDDLQTVIEKHYEFADQAALSYILKLHFNHLRYQKLLDAEDCAPLEGCDFMPLLHNCEWYSLNSLTKLADEADFDFLAAAFIEDLQTLAQFQNDLGQRL